jgi:hypothetical protein
MSKGIEQRQGRCWEVLNCMALQFDMFSDDERETGRKRGPSLPSIRQPSRELTEADMVRQLQDTGRYRILRKLEPRAVAELVRPDFPLRGPLEFIRERRPSLVITDFMMPLMNGLELAQAIGADAMIADIQLS